MSSAIVPRCCLCGGEYPSGRCDWHGDFISRTPDEIRAEMDAVSRHNYEWAKQNPTIWWDAEQDA
jgi:hypothetical protein